MIKKIIIICLSMIILWINQNSYGMTKQEWRDAYSFKNLFDNGDKKPRKYFSIASYYNMIIQQASKYYHTLSGYGFGIEGFVSNYLSVFFGFSDSYGQSDYIIDNAFIHYSLPVRSTLLTLGTRLYLSFIYFGGGFSVNFLHPDGKKPPNISLDSIYDMFLQLGLDLPLGSTGFSYDTGVNMSFGLGGLSKKVKIKPYYDIYMGFKYTFSLSKG